MLKDHPAYRSLPLPSNAPFKLGPSPGRNWGAFATMNISVGTRVLSEKPLFVIHKPHEFITEHDVRDALQKLTINDRKQFKQIQLESGTPPFVLQDTFAENCFCLPKAGHAYGLFPLMSRFNHSCVPNAKIPKTHMGQETISIYAVRDIKAGEEITFCYNPDFEGRRTVQRHMALRFKCDCVACLPGTRFHQLSELRRNLIRGLLFLTRGADPPTMEDMQSSPIITDLKMRREAAEFAIPLTSRFVYGLLTMCLLEDEGLLDHLMRGRIEAVIASQVKWFDTPENKRLAEAAMKTQSVRRRLEIALPMWGKPDIADKVLPDVLRTLMGVVLWF